MILFLDFDGVLHSTQAIEADGSIFRENAFKLIPALEAVLRDFPVVLIVISSVWRNFERLD